MDRFSLFRRSGLSGRLQGLKVRRRKAPAPSYAPGLLHTSPQNLESVNTVSTPEKSRTVVLFSGSWKYVLPLLLSFWYCVCVASPIVFTKSYPEAGSRINTFDFTLEFDISAAIEEAGPGEWGIGYSGSTRSSSKLKTILYEGNPGGEKIELAKALTANFLGNSDGFEVNGNTVKISFPSTLIPEPGKNYFLEIGNMFCITEKGSTTVHQSTSLQYASDPLVLTFQGAQPTSENLVFQSTTLETNKAYETIKDIEYSFNAEISIADGGVIISDDKGEQYTTTQLSISENHKSVKACFDPEISLWNGRSYTVKLLEGSVCLTSDANVKNQEIAVTVKGANTIKLPVIESSLHNDSKGLVDGVSIFFDIPEDCTMTLPKEYYSHKRKGCLYEGEVNDNKLVAELLGVVTKDGRGQSFDMSSISWQPSTKYTFVKPANEITVWKDDDTLPEYGNEEFEICWTSPSVTELNISPIQLGTPKIGDYADKASKELEDGGTYANINTLDILKPEYSYNGQTYKTTLDWNNAKIIIYDVTDGNRKLVKEGGISIAQREDYYEYFGVFVLSPKMDFMEGHTYEIVIPKGTIRLSENKPLFNYVTNDEIVYTVKGATPSEFKIESCSVEDNAEMSAVSAIVWTLNGTYDIKSADVKAEAKYSGKVGDALYTGKWYPSLTILKDGFKTYVSVQLSDPRTGQVANLQTGVNLTVTVPAGVIVYPGDDNLSNPEIILTIKGKDAVIEIPEAEMVNVNLTVDGVHSANHLAAKGKPYALTLTPEKNWVVESVTHDGKPLDEIGEGEFLTEPLEGDAELKASLKYNGSWAFENTTTHVWEIENSNVKIYADGNLIGVEGVTPEQTISVFNIGGLMINTGQVANGTDKAYITVAPGQTYIVTVDGIAAKITLK